MPLHQGMPKKALLLFLEMETNDVKPNVITLIGVLSAYVKKLNFEFRR